jgi:hypothetical protein
MGDLLAGCETRTKRPRDLKKGVEARVERPRGRKGKAGRFFAAITDTGIRRGVFQSVATLEKAIMEYLAHHNENPKPFVWTAEADLILDRVKQVCERIPHSGHHTDRPSVVRLSRGLEPFCHDWRLAGLAGIGALPGQLIAYR